MKIAKAPSILEISPWTLLPPEDLRSARRDSVDSPAKHASLPKLPDYFALKSPEDFATNSARGPKVETNLERPWLEKFPFQPEWVPWHPAYSLDSYLFGPPRYRQTVRLIDAAFARLYLEWARTKDTDHRKAKRIFEEKLYDRKLTQKWLQDDWLSRHDFAIKLFWERMDRIQQFIEDRIKRGQAIKAYRLMIEAMTAHEKFMTESYAAMIRKRKDASIILGERQFYTMTENGAVVTLPQYGHALQVVWGKMFRDSVHLREAEQFAWHASHLYGITANQGIVPMPIRGQSAGEIGAILAQRHGEDMHRKAAYDLTTTEQKKKFDYQRLAHILSLKRSRAYAKASQEGAQKQAEEMAATSKPAMEKNAAELTRVYRSWVDHADETDMRQTQTAKWVSQRLETEVRDEELSLATKDPDKNPALGIPIDKKIASRDSHTLQQVSDKHAAQPQAESKPRVFDRPVRVEDELERSFDPVLDLSIERKERFALKDLQKNLASQSAGAESLLAQHVRSPHIKPSQDFVPPKAKKA